MEQKNDDQIPAIRTFQFSEDGIGSIPDSVNLFRGDVALSIPLLTLPGRNGLDVTVNALYSSNVQTSVDRWNREAPTSILGEGWNLPYETIEVEPRGSSSLEDNLYSIVNGESRTPLLRSAIPWMLFDLEVSFMAGLEGGTVTEELALAFASRGFALAAGQPVETLPEGWRIVDSVQQRLYRIERQQELLAVTDGGLGFETESYQFWKICYYPEFEHWLIVKEDGSSHHYGGVDEAIQWGVRWGNWYGTSTLTEGQERYPRSWNLNRMESPWGDRVSYGYESVEQQVGDGGLPYTKACYLSSITDTFGRRALFQYEEKVYVADDPAGPREFQDPHKEIPDTLPNAYQDRYETRFLKAITVEDSSGEILYDVDLGYELLNVTGIDPEDRLYGDTCKRYLRTVTQRNGDQDSLPGMLFDYYRLSTDPHPGALRTVTYPEGGVATYDYAQQDLPLCARELTVERPARGEASSWVPRVWFGPDYAAVVWYNTDSTELELSLYTWLGFWYRWSTQSMTFKASLVLDSLNGQAGEGLFLLTYQSRNADELRGHLFHKLDNTVGQWVMSQDELRVSSGEGRFLAGKEFVLAVDGSEMTRLSWQWRNRSWSAETLDLSTTCTAEEGSQNQYYVAASNNFYLVFCYDAASDPETRKNTLRLTFQDALGGWHDGGETHPDDISIGQIPNRETFFWSLGETFAVATYQTANHGSAFDYAVHIFHWDEDYQFLPAMEFRKDLSGQELIPYVGAISGNSLVASGPHLFRFDGAAWLEEDLSLRLPASPSNSHWFSNTPDLALVTENGADQIVSQMLAYDPNTDSGAWSGEPQTLVDLTEPLPFQKTHFFPTTGAEYATLGRDLFFRGSSNAWASLAQGEPAYSTPATQSVDTTTTINEGPSFIAYLEVDEESSTLVPLRTWVLNLKNGRVGEIEGFEEQIFKVYGLDGYPRASSGQGPAGPQSLVTYPLEAKSFNEADRITLRRHVDGTVQGLVRAYTVVGVTIDSGYDRNENRYDYDTQSAACDPSGQVVKYFRVSQYATQPGGEGRPSGWTESIYINGLPTELPALARSSAAAGLTMEGLRDAQNNFSVLDGYLKRQSSFDVEGNLVASTQNEWTVRLAIEDAQGTPQPIRGSFVVQRSQTKMIDQVETPSTMVYDLSSGQLLSQGTDLYNSLGEPEVQEQATVYAYQVYPLMRSHNRLKDQAETSVSVRPLLDGEPGGRTAIKVSATRFRDWPRMLTGGKTIAVLDASETYSWRGGGEAAFTAWAPESTPSAAWCRTSSVVSRSAHGQVLEALDALGRTTSTFYDLDERWPIATFSNASREGDEASYLGFQTYQGEGAWALSSGESWETAAVDGQGHTGSRCLRLSAATTGERALERTFTPAAQNGRFLFAAWSKTEEGFVPTEDAKWTLRIHRGSAVLETLDLPFEDTAGDWRYSCRTVDLAPYAASGPGLSITVAGANPSAAGVLVDDLRFSPWESEFKASVYEPRYDLETATLGPYYETVRRAYDDLHRQIATSGPAESVAGLESTYLSRQWNDTFQSSEPNATVTLKGTGRGFFGDFFRDGGWQSHFETPDPGQWSVTDGRLIHSGSGASSIRLVEPNIEADYGAYLTVSPETAPSQPLGLRVGDRLTVTWDPTIGTWELVDAAAAKSLAPSSGNGSAKSLAPRRTPPTRGRRTLDPSTSATGQSSVQQLQREWLLVVSGSVLLFYADGEQLFAYRSATEIQGELEIFTGDPVALGNVLLAEGAQVNRYLRDGAGHDKQIQALDGDHSVIRESLYDPQGRQVVTTKAAILPPTEASPLLTYRESLVTGMDWASGVMTGEVSEYYSPAGGGFSDDQGYPYRRQRYEDSPLGRVVEQGLAGKDFAIVDLGTTTAEERPTAKVFYGASSASGFMGWLPPGRYAQTTYIDADGRRREQMRDAAGTVVGQGALLDPQTERFNTTAYQTSYSETGATTLTLQPNSFDPPAPGTESSWQLTSLVDPLGNKIRVTTPDSGWTEMIYDPLGNLRFSQSADGREQGYFVYQRYDALNRPVEIGALAQGWDPAFLQDKADTDPAWPPTPDTWARISEYGGDGTDPLALGRLACVLVAREDDAGTIGSRETYTYDLDGQVRRVGQEILEEGSSNEYPTSFQFNNLQQITAIRYEAGAEASTSPLVVLYRYDRMGRLAEVRKGEGSPGTDPVIYAQYTYNSAGAIATETLLPGTAAETTRRKEYNSPGWITRLTGGAFSQTVYYTQDRDGQPGYHSGLVAQDAFTFQGDLPADTTRDGSYRYSYDPLTQLTAAQASASGTAQPQWDFGTALDPVTYDANGNLGSVPRSGQPLSLSYIPGTDQVMNLDGSNQQAFSYDANGAVTRSDPRGIPEIRYQRASGRTAWLRGPAGEVSFVYNGLTQRLRKTTPDLDRIYVHGVMPLPLVELERRRDTLVRSRYIYGAQGQLLGFVRGEELRMVLTDRLGSSRALLRPDGSIGATWTFWPFGETLQRCGEDAPLLRYLFTGQELDEDLGLYNFRARLYDPQIGRFYGVDPQWQFASPYLYAGNDPILLIDPTGELAGWVSALLATAAIATAAVAIIAGVAITIASGGVAAPIIAALGVEAGGLAATLITGAVVVGGGAIGGALTFGGLSSVTYSVSHFKDWSPGTWAKETFTGVGIGALTGGVSGLTTFGLSTAVTQGWLAAGKASTLIAGTVIQGGTNAVLSGIDQVVSNAINPDAAWYDSLAQSMIMGGITGGVSGANTVRAAGNVVLVEQRTAAAAMAEVDDAAQMGGIELQEMGNRRPGLQITDTSTSSRVQFPDMEITH